MAKVTYYDTLKATVTTADGLEKVPVEDLEVALAVMIKWFPKPLYLPSLFMDAEHVGIMDGAYWRFRACEQLANHIAERKAPKDKTTKTE